MIKFTFLTAALVFAGLTVGAETEGADEEKGLFEWSEKEYASPAPLMSNSAGRSRVSLNGAWNILVDEHEIGERGLLGGAYHAPVPPLTGMELVEHSFDERRQLNVPGDWNTQDDHLFRYRGVVWYQRNVTLNKKAGERYFLHFDGVNYFANVYVNGKPLATHKGGYVAFNVEATDALVDGDNYISVRVDGYLDESTIPTARTSDFFKYSGITRDVHLITVPETFIQQYHVYLDDLEDQSFKAWVQLDGGSAAGQQVTIRIPELDVEAAASTNEDGYAELSFSAEAALWSPENPKLYNVSVVSSGSRLDDRIGFRTVEVADGKILLNGEVVFLRGISMHDESYLKSGVAYDAEDARAQLGLIKELNGNFVRLAHYPHNEYAVRAADELGLMVWSEIPIVSVIDWGNEETLAVARQQISDNVHRDLNRASIVMWSVANETSPQTPERLAFLKTLATDARTIDKSGRPIAAALVGDVTQEFADVTKRLVAEFLNDPEIDDPETRAQLEAMADELIGDDMDAVLNGKIQVVLKDELGSVVDIIGYNEYFGWYYAAFLHNSLPVDEATTRRTIFRIMNDIRFVNVFGKPIIISEFGAGAKKGYVSPHGDGSIWTEAYQARVYEHQLDMLDRNDAVQGMSPWILKDFRSALRQLNGIQENYNRKGIVSEKGEKKQAFYVLRDYYQRKAEE
tara:strand:- start:1886 stop:3940 length:2055 start_codon:yes stop_codon:yes gene_type:complete